MRATANSAGYEAPPPHGTILLEEGGVMTVLEMSVGGNLFHSRAVRGREANALDEVTCTFSLPDGTPFVIIGLLADR